MPPDTGANEKPPDVGIRYELSASVINLACIAAVAIYVATLGSGHNQVAFDTSRPVSDQIGDVLLFALLCGTLTFATIEVLKRIVGARGLYQRMQTLSWFRDRTESPEKAFRELGEAMGATIAPKPSRVQKGFFTADVARVFNLPTEQLAAQISIAGDVALTDPGRYPALLDALTGGQPRKEASEKSDKGSQESEQERGREAAQDKEQHEEAPREDDDRFKRAQRVRAGVDQLQISLGARWQRLMQGAALWIAGTFGILLTQASSEQDTAEARFVLAALIIGGPFAWLIRDVFAVVERLRR